MKKRDETSPLEAHISASILVNRPSQRAIVVGRGGSIIKEIGVNARKKIEAMIGGKVHLNLHVKVSPKWFNNNFVLDEIDQFTVGVEMNGLDSDLHGVFLLIFRPEGGRVYILL